jgi:hypothetical protein
MHESVSQPKLYIHSNLDLSQRRGAAFARMLAYARALRDAYGVETRLLSFAQPLCLGLEESIEPGILVCGRPRDRRGRLRHLWVALFWKSLALGDLLRMRRLLAACPGPRALLIYPSHHSLLLEAFSLLLLRGIPGLRLISEENEGEWAIQASREPVAGFAGLLARLFRPFRLLAGLIADRLGGLADGVIAISTRLEATQRRHNRCVIRVPILAADGLAQDEERVVREGPLRIGYFGGLLPGKEGLETLLEALAACGDHELEFAIHGFGRPADAARLEGAIARLGLAGKVRLAGSMPHHAIAARMLEQDLLVLPRPSTPQNEAGFSTKLAEYLGSGRAVLATTVSDIPLYLRDGESAFLVPPEDIAAISAALRRVFALDRGELDRIGRAGKEVARQNFLPAGHASALYGMFFDAGPGC